MNAVPGLWFAGVGRCLVLLLVFGVGMVCVGCGPRGEAGGEALLSISGERTWRIPAADRFLPAPRGLYSDERDDVYVLDDAGRVLVYDGAGVLQRQWKMPDSRIGNPEGIWKLRDGRVAVADTHYHRVVIFRADGEVDLMFGSEGREAGQFVFPVAVLEDGAGNLYVGEYGDHQRVQKFDGRGHFLLQFGRHGSGPGEFQRPSGLALRGGEVFVVDAFNDRIQVFSEAGEFRRILKLSDKFESLSYPYDLRVTAEGLVYVIENRAARLTVMDLEGNLVGRYGTPGRNSQQFYQPWDLTVLTDGRILVADTGNHRLVELTP
jgi:DNA-binding beta-propeller fold protein YncE